MKRTAHTLPPDVLCAYAAGRVDPALGLLIETQMQLDDATAEQVSKYEGLGGALLESEAPASMSESALSSVLAMLDQGPKDPAHPIAANDDDLDAFPEPLRTAARRAFANGGWRFAGPGLRTISLPTSGEAKVDLLRIQPGFGAPRHTHEGAEITLVVRGAFSDETGRYGPGDVSIASQAVTHRPIAEEGETCYALSVTDAPLAFTGALGWLQRAVRT
ncbi:MAG: ChrR family anti-sigma-E factor [Pseudomonadota bacterium]